MLNSSKYIELLFSILSERIAHSKRKEGLFTSGVLSLVFLPVEAVSARADEIYPKAKAAVAKLGSTTTPPGLLEQYKVQLERLEPGKNQAGPGVEFGGSTGVCRVACRRATFADLFLYLTGPDGHPTARQKACQRGVWY